jgi:hypothetical protein
VYIDGGSNGGASGLNIYDNVGWNISSGTVGLVTNGVANTKVLNNDGGVFLFQLASWAADSKVQNNIGDVAEINLGSGVTVLADHNLTDVNTNDPKYTDEAARNYTLQAGSPAAGTGVTASPGTDDYTGTGSPNRGAYQSSTSWAPGATSAPATPIRPQWGSSALTTTGSWNYPSSDHAAPIGRMDSHPTNPFADMWTGQSGTATGGLHFTLATPGSGLHTIDRVYVLLYARMHRNLSTTEGNVVLTMPTIGTVYDANGLDFENVGKPIKVEITSQVAGNPLNIPTSADVAVTLGLEPQLGTGVTPYGVVDVYAVEIYVEAH